MWKKVICVIAGMLAVVVLIAGTVSTTYADSGQQGGKPALGRMPPGGGVAPGGDKMLERVSQIVKIDKQQLADAFKQAATEMRQQGLNDMFSKWVTDGKLNQEQADQYKAWLADNPNPNKGFPCMNSQLMDKLLKDGKVTQAQYDAYKEWMGKKPNVELPKPERPQGAPQGGGHSKIN
ncbi:MAG: hypothetical protein NT082_03080 [Chloroflexi bacterium]|nr:hypothetical protein [Chloroflexota bacterium]